jgi:cyclic pyranopterin phosphate synthase
MFPWTFSMATVRSAHTQPRVADRLGRMLHDLRISVIDQCNLRCPYCMPLDRFGEGYKFLPDSQLLTFEEIDTLARAFVRLGVSKLRITGGEPLLRKGLPELIQRLHAIDGVEDIALTTNGLLLRRQAAALREAGLRRVTVSLDSLDDEISGRLNGRGAPVANVLDGIAAAQSAGFDSIKVNAVVQRGVNDHTVLDMVEHFRGTGIVVRFIEYMDVGTRNHWKLDEVVSSRELRDRIHARYPLRAADPNYCGEVASRYSFEDGQGEVGFISSVTETFCGDCTRARISADGVFYTCLFAATGTDLRGPMRAGVGAAGLDTLLRRVWSAREDRYSELRAVKGAQLGTKVEMYRMGG